MAVWRLPLKIVLLLCLLTPATLAQVPNLPPGVDTAGPLNETGALPDCRPFPGLMPAAIDLSTGPAGAHWAGGCRLATERGVDRVVTGHTVFVGDVQAPADAVRFTLRSQPYGPPAPEASPQAPDADRLLPIRHGQPPVDRIRMAECVVWTNGMNHDVRPRIAVHDDDENWFPSDEDQPYEPGRPHDVAGLDHDMDHHVDTCVPELEDLAADASAVGVPTDFAGIMGALWDLDGAPVGAGFAVVVERGDCSPAEGTHHRYRGALDFVDPNHVYHEVQEYDYRCPNGGPANAAHLPPGTLLEAVVDDLEPPMGESAPKVDETPRCDPLMWAPVDEPADTEHRCVGMLGDQLRERFWVTPLHEPVVDYTIQQSYTFALIVDTCAGVNSFDGVTLHVAGQAVTPVDQSVDPYGVTRDRHPHALHGIAHETQTPLPGHWDDTCTSGSSFSFDDTERGRTIHVGMPAALGDQETMDGNSLDFDSNTATFGTHRTNCRHNLLEWPYNQWPSQVGRNCYPEDHKDAPVDVYVFRQDPTGGLVALYRNWLTGPNVYVGPGVPSGPDQLPPQDV